MSAPTYRGAAVWLLTGRFDLRAALDVAQDADWSVDEFGGVRGFGYSDPPLPDHLDRLAGAVHTFRDESADDSDKEITATVDEVLREVAELVPNLTWDTNFDQDVARAHALLFVTALALEIELGAVSNHRDAWYDVAPTGTVITFGAISSGRDDDRPTMTAIEAVLSLPAFVSVLRAGGALPPSQWALRDVRELEAG